MTITPQLVAGGEAVLVRVGVYGANKMVFICFFFFFSSFGKAWGGGGRGQGRIEGTQEGLACSTRLRGKRL